MPTGADTTPLVEEDQSEIAAYEEALDLAHTNTLRRIEFVGSTAVSDKVVGIGTKEEIAVDMVLRGAAGVLNKMRTEDHTAAEAGTAVDAVADALADMTHYHSDSIRENAAARRVIREHGLVMRARVRVPYTARSGVMGMVDEIKARRTESLAVPVTPPSLAGLRIEMSSKTKRQKAKHVPIDT